jgi:uncharacterized protein (PEP-CTERM system associated)
VRRATERTTLEASGGVREYRIAETGNLETTSYSVRGTAGHSLSSTSKITGSLTVERLEDKVAGTAVSRYLSGVRFERVVKESFIWALDYRYTNVYSPDAFGVNYYNNRFMVELTKKF